MSFCLHSNLTGFSWSFYYLHIGCLVCMTMYDDIYISDKPMYSTNFYSSIHCLHLPLDNIHSFGRQKLKLLLCAVVLKLSWVRFVSWRDARKVEDWVLIVVLRFFFGGIQNCKKVDGFVQTLLIIALWLVLFVFITNHSTVATITQLLPCLTASQGRGIFQHCQGCHGVSRSKTGPLTPFGAVMKSLVGWVIGDYTIHLYRDYFISQ